MQVRLVARAANSANGPPHNPCGAISAWRQAVTDNQPITIKSDLSPSQFLQANRHAREASPHRLSRSESRLGDTVHRIALKHSGHRGGFVTMSVPQDPVEYWGKMIRPDKGASELFNLLLRGIANYVVSGELDIRAIELRPWEANRALDRQRQPKGC
jgi:hypothetical protein